MKLYVSATFCVVLFLAFRVVPFGKPNLSSEEERRQSGAGWVGRYYCEDITAVGCPTRGVGAGNGAPCFSLGSQTTVCTPQSQRKCSYGLTYPFASNGCSATASGACGAGTTYTCTQTGMFATWVGVGGANCGQYSLCAAP